MLLQAPVEMFRREQGNALPLLLYYIEEEYSNAHPNLLSTIPCKQTAWMGALRLAEQNGLLYLFTRRLLEKKVGFSENYLRDIIEKEQRALIEFRKTLEFLLYLSGREEVDLLFVKLYRGLPYVPRDIDVLVKREDMAHVLSALRKNGFVVNAFDDVEATAWKKGSMKVDLYQTFHYLSTQFIDQNLLWENQRIAEMCDVPCPIPSREADILILAIHALLGHRYLSLLDFLYAKTIVREGWRDVLSETKRYGWTHAFLMFVNTIMYLYNALYESSQSHNSVTFPLLFSPGFLLRAFCGFDRMQLSVKAKMSFVGSTLFDYLVYRYQLLNQSTSIESPDALKNVFTRASLRFRSLAGDRH